MSGRSEPTNTEVKTLSKVSNLTNSVHAMEDSAWSADEAFPDIITAVVMLDDTNIKRAKEDINKQFIFFKGTPKQIKITPLQLSFFYLYAISSSESTEKVITTIKLLFEHGAKLNLDSQADRACFIVALKANVPEFVALVANKTSIPSKKFKHNLVSCAAETHSAKVLNSILKSLTSHTQMRLVNLPVGKDLNTPLHIACLALNCEEYECEAIISGIGLLIVNRANPKCKNKAGLIPAQLITYPELKKGAELEIDKALDVLSSTDPKYNPTFLYEDLPKHNGSGAGAGGHSANPRTIKKAVKKDARMRRNHTRAWIEAFHRTLLSPKELAEIEAEVRSHSRISSERGEENDYLYDFIKEQTESTRKDVADKASEHLPFILDKSKPTPKGLVITLITQYVCKLLNNLDKVATDTARACIPLLLTKGADFNSTGKGELTAVEHISDKQTREEIASLVVYYSSVKELSTEELYEELLRKIDDLVKPLPKLTLTTKEIKRPSLEECHILMILNQAKGNFNKDWSEIDSRTPLSIATRAQHIGLIQLLIQHGADVTQPLATESDKTSTLLHLICAESCSFSDPRELESVIESLLKAGANPLLRDGNGNRPIDLLENEEGINAKIKEIFHAYSPESILARVFVDKYNSLIANPTHAKLKQFLTCSQTPDDPSHKYLDIVNVIASKDDLDVKIFNQTVEQYTLLLQQFSCSDDTPAEHAPAGQSTAKPPTLMRFFLHLHQHFKTPIKTLQNHLEQYYPALAGQFPEATSSSMSELLLDEIFLKQAPALFDRAGINFREFLVKLNKEDALAKYDELFPKAEPTLLLKPARAAALAPIEDSTDRAVQLDIERQMERAKADKERRKAEIENRKRQIAAEKRAARSHQAALARTETAAEEEKPEGKTPPKAAPHALTEKEKEALVEQMEKTQTSRLKKEDENIFGVSPHQKNKALKRKKKKDKSLHKYNLNDIAKKFSSLWGLHEADISALGESADCARQSRTHYLLCNLCESIKDQLKVPDGTEDTTITNPHDKHLLTRANQVRNILAHCDRIDFDLRDTTIEDFISQIDGMGSDEARLAYIQPVVSTDPMVRANELVKCIRQVNNYITKHQQLIGFAQLPYSFPVQFQILQGIIIELKHLDSTALSDTDRESLPQAVQAMIQLRNDIAHTGDAVFIACLGLIHLGRESITQLNQLLMSLRESDAKEESDIKAAITAMSGAGASHEKPESATDKPPVGSLLRINASEWTPAARIPQALPAAAPPIIEPPLPPTHDAGASIGPAAYTTPTHLPSYHTYAMPIAPTYVVPMYAPPPLPTAPAPATSAAVPASPWYPEYHGYYLQDPQPGWPPGPS